MEFTGYTLKPPQSPGWKVLRQGPHPRGIGLAKRGQDRISLVWAGSFLLALDSSIDGIVRGLVGQPHWGEEEQFFDSLQFRELGTPIEDNLALPGPPFALASLDGSLWIATSKDGSLFRISPETNQVVAEIEVPARCRKVVSGAGSCWAVCGMDHLVRIDPKTNTVQSTIKGPWLGKKQALNPLPPVLTGLVFAEPWLWVVDGEHNRVFRVDPATNQVHGAAIKVGKRPVDIVATESSVWTVNRSGESTQLNQFHKCSPYGPASGRWA